MIFFTISVVTVYSCGNEEKDLTYGKEIELGVLNLFTKDCENFFLSKIFSTTLLLLNTYSQYFHCIYDLIRPCRVSIISLKETSFAIFSSTFLIEWRTVE